MYFMHFIQNVFVCIHVNGFSFCVIAEDNELLTLEVIHQFVEVLDKYFKNVCELDLIFNFHKVNKL